MIGGVSSAAQYYGDYRNPGYVQKGAAVEQNMLKQGAGNQDAAGQATAANVQTGQGQIVPIVQADAQNGIPFLKKGADPAEMAVRMRMQYSGGAGVEGVQKAAEKGECKTCKERKYQDGSDDPGVSFKTPTNIAPEQAASAVVGHEMEHVSRETAKAQREDRKVVSQSVTIHTAICPECGKAYVSGGTTRTTTAANPKQEAGASEGQQGRTPFSAVA